jgi:hypothetical protein
MDYAIPVKEEILNAAQKALEANGFAVSIAENAGEAKSKVLALIPEGAEVFTMTSMTLEALGIPKEINESGKYNSVRNKLNDPNTPAREKKRLGAAPEWTIGSVNAVAATGSLLNGSNTGSQLGAYAYGADHVIFVVGAQKIAPSVDEAIKRIYDYVLPKETLRARAAYNLPEFKSFVSKLLITNREVIRGRTTIVLVKEAVGF